MNYYRLWFVDGTNDSMGYRCTSIRLKDGVFNCLDNSGDAICIVPVSQVKYFKAE